MRLSVDAIESTQRHFKAQALESVVVAKISTKKSSSDHAAHKISTKN